MSHTEHMNYTPHLVCYGEIETDNYAETWRPNLDEALALALQLEAPFEIWFNHPETEEWMPCCISI